MSLDDFYKTDKDNDNDKAKNKSRLDSLKAQIISDPFNFNTDDHLFSNEDFPTTDFNDIEKPVDYSEKKLDINSIVTEEIISIIDIYIKEEKLLKSARLISKKNNFVRKYTSLLLILEMYEQNLITLQESIDVGDRSKDQFDLVNRTGGEIAKILIQIDNLLISCEKFFEEYAEKYGMESEEEKIVATTVSDDNGSDDSRVTVLTMTEISNAIKEQLDKQEEEKKKKEDTQEE